MQKCLISKIAVTFEMITGRGISEPVADMMIAILDNYDPSHVNRALDRCLTECKGALALADIVARIPTARPSANEAWAMLPRSEADTVVWTDEMREAYGLALPIMDDRIAARMAFMEAYNRAMLSVPNPMVPPSWSVSFGSDVAQRAQKITEAVAMGRLPMTSQFLAMVEAPKKEEAKLLPERKPTDDEAVEIQSIVSDLLKSLRDEVEA
jgi:hypothetical protein